MNENGDGQTQPPIADPPSNSSRASHRPVAYRKRLIINASRARSCQIVVVDEARLATAKPVLTIYF